jgi:SecD/SecF fusion protein
MNRSHLWKFLFVVFVVFWSFTEIWPPKAQNLADKFDELAVSPDTNNYKAILDKARALEAQFPNRSYSNLLAAIGTNDIRRYFPTNFVNYAAERNPTRAILNRVQREAAGKFRLGLDLQGGTAFLLELDTSKLGTNSLASTMGQSYLVDQAVSVLRRRVDAFGVAEPVIQPAGDNRILVQLPGLSEADKIAAKEGIQKAAFLEFRMVDPDQTEHLQSGLIPPGYELKQEKRHAQDGREGYVPVIVRKTPERGLTGKYVSGAHVTRDPLTGKPEIAFTLNSEGAEIFAEVTRQNVGQSLAIILDGEVVSAPRINGVIPGGSGQITGDFSEKEAVDLATALENPLQTPLRIIEERGVDPSLGADSVRSGIKASLIGTIAVALFMAIYYLRAGLVANVALLTNIIVLLGIMCSLNVTYTLPGIAGIVLTVGMAVDANVLIYERIREELAKGKSMRGALSAGYDRAFATIFDSHITTLISSVILIILGTGTIKGFGVSLTIGVAVSLFTALIVTRLIFDALLAKGWLKSLPMLHIIRASNLDFMKLAKIAFTLSWAIIVVGIGYGAFVRGSSLLGIDFAGGESITYSFDPAHRVDVDKLRTTLNELKFGEPQVGYQNDSGSGKQSLRVTVGVDREAIKLGKPSNRADLVDATLKKQFPEAKFGRLATEQVGPTVGEEIQKSAIIASLLSLFGILVYVAFRYEFSFAVGAVVAVIHDVLMTIGCYSLTGLFGEGRQFNATFVAALLTIIGFSINDTIVIFDRIREDLKLGIPGSFTQILNKALNQTLSRTIITSGTVFLATASLYLFGGGPINDFAFTFLVGIITGTYSSIYIASALVLWWHKGQRPAIGTNVPVPTGADRETASARA